VRRSMMGAWYPSRSLVISRVFELVEIDLELKLGSRGLTFVAIMGRSHATKRRLQVIEEKSRLFRTLIYGSEGHLTPPAVFKDLPRDGGTEDHLKSAKSTSAIAVCWRHVAFFGLHD
jgi:hypothetical protein